MVVRGRFGGLRVSLIMEDAGKPADLAYRQDCISHTRKRTMSLIDEFNAATQSLDRILEKMEEAAPADKERLEAYVKSMQVKVQQILKAILRVH